MKAVYLFNLCFLFSIDGTYGIAANLNISEYI